MARLVAGIAVLAALACGCADDTVVDTYREPSAGALSLSYLAGPGKAAATQAHVQDTAHFGLGDLKASRDFYFVIRNTGGRDIRDVVVSSDNPAFTVSPSLFDILPPDSVAGITALLRITAVHGVALDGIGYTAVLPMDSNHALIRVAGVTQSTAGADTSVQTTARLSLKALVMGVRLFSGSTEIALGDAPLQVSSAIGGLGWVELYNQPDLSLVNSGNVPIIITAHMLPTQSVGRRDTLDIGDTIAGPCTGCIARLDGGNTITDPTKLQIGNDGAAYVAF